LESELVAGFMTEHGASIFVFFFLGEYSSLILMSSFMSIFFLGGHHCPDIHKLILDPFIFLFYLLEYQFSYYFPLTGYSPIKHDNIQPVNDYFINLSSKNTMLDSFNILIDKIQGSYILGFKIIIVVFFYIWVRASFPRFRYDQLMSLCWKELLPLVFAYILFTICLFYTFDMMPFGITF
jgi:NADH-ubiquinone oxidoreductase chain 1